MGKIRDGARTRHRILNAAAAEFAERGFDAARVSGIARRCNLSKQLIHHHFGGKEKLFQALHDVRFRPHLENHDLIPADPNDLFAARFLRHMADTDYIRFQTWEAARGRTRRLPGESVRQKRIAQYGTAIATLQADGKLPAELNPKLIQLAVFALSTYPMAFGQITRLVTGHESTDPKFQREWADFLRAIGALLVSGGKS